MATRYFSSEFMGHSTAEDMVEVFHKSTEGLGYKNLVQLSMDGPNVNLKFHKPIQTEMENDVNTVLLNVAYIFCMGLLKRVQMPPNGI